MKHKKNKFTVIGVSLKAEERELLVNTAQKEQRSLSNWCRVTLLSAAKQPDLAPRHTIHELAEK